MSEEIIKVLDDLGRRFGITLDWTNENMMPYLKELANRIIQYEITTSIIWMVICVVGMVVSLVLSKWLFKKGKESQYHEECFVVVGISLIAFAILLCFPLIVQIFDIAKALTLPELTIMQFINHQKQ